MDEFSLDWQARSSGSAVFSFKFPEAIVEVHTTYIGDGLGSVLQAAIDLQGGSSSAIAFLPAEPGGTCLFFAGAESDVFLQIVDFENMESESRRWTGGSLRWHGQLGVERFIDQLVCMAEGILANNGSTEEYSAAWAGYTFPLARLERLRARAGQ